MSVNEKMTAIAQKIRVYKGGSAKLTLDEMPAAIDEAYTKAKSAGKREWQDIFWQVYQAEGTLKEYSYAFNGDKWTDEIYSPRYTIRPGRTNGLICTYKYTQITDTLVEIDATVVNDLTQTFQYASNLRNIVKIKLNGSNRFTNTFDYCYALTSIRFEGTISNDINLQWSDLDFLSAKSVVSALKNFNGNVENYTKTIYLSEATKDLLRSNQHDTEDISWLDYIEHYLCWNVA